MRVECFPWNSLKKVTNIADYDAIVLNLLSLEDPSKLDVLAFRRVLDIRTAQQVLSKSKTGGAIYVLGDPRFTTVWEFERVRQEDSFLDWTGIEFAWDDRLGTTVERRWDANRELFKLFAVSRRRARPPSCVCPLHRYLPSATPFLHERRIPADPRARYDG